MFLTTDPDANAVIAHGRRYPVRKGVFLVADTDRHLFSAFPEADDVGEVGAELHALGNWDAEAPIETILADIEAAQLDDEDTPEDDGKTLDEVLAEQEADDDAVSEEGDTGDSDGESGDAGDGDETAESDEDDTESPADDSEPNEREEEKVEPFDLDYDTLPGLKRPELDELAARLKIAEPERLQNKLAVIDAITTAHKAL